MIRTITTAAIAIVMAGAGLGLAMLNSAPVQMNFHYATVTWPLAQIIVLCFAVGAIVGLLACSLIILRLKRQVASLRRENERSTGGSRGLRAVPVR